MDALLNMVISEHHLSATMVHGRTHRMTEMVARLAPGATLDQARAEVAAVRTPDPDRSSRRLRPRLRLSSAVIPFREVLGERARLTLWLLMGAAVFVMIISSANVANLTLMRGVRREHELVLRAALGAGAARLRRLLLVENLLLAFLGAALGMLLAIGGVGLLISLAERYSPRASEIRLDAMVLGFTLALSLLVALLLSFAPTLPKEGTLRRLARRGARMSAGLRGQRLQRGLVVAQIAVSVILLTGAGLLTRTMLRAFPGGDRPDDRGSAHDAGPAVPVTGSDADAKALYDRMRLEIGAIPGVIEVGHRLRDAASRHRVPARGQGRGQSRSRPASRCRAPNFGPPSPEYFRAAGIPLIRGTGVLRHRWRRLRAGGDPQPDVRRTRCSPAEDPLGQAGRAGPATCCGSSGQRRMAHRRRRGRRYQGRRTRCRSPPGHVPCRSPRSRPSWRGLVIRAERDAAALAPAATRIVRRIAPQVPIENVLTVAQIRDESVAPRRLNAALVSSFGVLAVIIAAVGIAGVLAFSVSARTNEIGIRMSLGADSGRVQRMILREGGVLLVIGLALGIGGALVASRLIRGLLFGVAPHDPLTLVGVALIMAVVGIGACWLPALRAARIDPIVAIRGS